MGTLFCEEIIYPHPSESNENKMKNKIEMRTSVAYMLTLSQTFAQYFFFCHLNYVWHSFTVFALRLFVVPKCIHTHTFVRWSLWGAVRCNLIKYKEEKVEIVFPFVTLLLSSRGKENIKKIILWQREKEKQTPINIMKRGKKTALSNRYDRMMAIDRTKEREIENSGCRIKNNLWLVMLMMRFQFFFYSNAFPLWVGFFDNQ